MKLFSFTDFDPVTPIEILERDIEVLNGFSDKQKQAVENYASQRYCQGLKDAYDNAVKQKDDKERRTKRSNQK